MKEEALLTRFDSSTTFIGHKLVMLGLALIAPPMPRLMIALNAALCAEAVIEWGALLGRARTPEEPWVTLIVGVICSAFVVWRMYHRRVEQRLVRTLMENAAYERIVLAFAAIRDRAGRKAPFYLLPGLEIEISASEIRRQAGATQDSLCAEHALLPDAVCSYIAIHGLYR